MKLTKTTINEGGFTNPAWAFADHPEYIATGNAHNWKVLKGNEVILRGYNRKDVINKFADWIKAH